ncbi:MAG: PAS domain S-box protein, partial [Desulfobacterales bacterium]|nr:PAS domain S-box protein [Desulfobacterales bacterium]
YYLSHFFLRKKDKPPLYFGTFCLLVVLRILTTGERYFIHLFPGIGWELMVKIEYITFYLAIPLFAMFIHSLFYREFSKQILRIIQFLGIIFSLIVLLTPAKIYSHTVYPYQIITLMSCIYGIYGLTLSLVRKREGAFIISLGFFILFLSVINDILLYNRVITRIGPLVPLGLFTFIFFQSFLISRRFSMAFNTVEKQSHDLKKTNIAYLQEISERKRAVETLRESEEKYRLHFYYVTDVVYSLDKELNVLEVSPSVERLLGYLPKELVGKNFLGLNILAPEFFDKVYSDIIHVFDGNTLSSEVYEFIAKDGTRKIGEVSGSPLYRDGKIVALVAVARDITEKKQAEGYKKKLETQLQQAQKMEAVGTLAGGIAHDFNNLLMAILGRTSLTLAYIDSSHPHYENLTEIEKYVISASDLTKQLLGFARGGMYEVKPTDINTLIKDQSEMFGRTRKEIAIHGKYADDLWTAEVDKNQIEQVLMNIFVNAWQAMPDGGELYLQTENVKIDDDYKQPFHLAPGKYIKISVTDTGIGMNEETKKKIFDPFFTTKAKQRGTGMGLSSAYGIIKNHNGFINVYSEPGQGSTFYIYLPASEKKVIAIKEPSEELVNGTGTVLLVDDEDMILSVGEKILNMLGYDVMTASSGQEAIDTYRENRDKINLVILDMIMPKMSGSETYDSLKEINPDVTVLLSSGYSLNGKAKDILNKGCAGFIQKPFTMKQLSQKIGGILNKTRNTISGI